MSTRALSPVFGVVCLLAVTIALAVAVGAGATTYTTMPSTVSTAAFDLSADSTGEVRIVHRGGDTIDPTALELRVHVGGKPLEQQPPVPFFSARGFGSGPTGAFNSATSQQWRAGETASFQIAETNDPMPHAGDTVSVELFADGRRIANLETTV